MHICITWPQWVIPPSGESTQGLNEFNTGSSNILIQSAITNVAHSLWCQMDLTRWWRSLGIKVIFSNIFLTHWGRVTHICVDNLTVIGSDNGLSPGRRQAIIWTNAGIFLIGPLGTNVSEIFIEIYTFLFNKMHLKMSSGKWRPSCLGLNVLNTNGSHWWYLNIGSCNGLVPSGCQPLSEPMLTQLCH